MALPNIKIDRIELSIVLPCLNEENAIKTCLDSICTILQKNHFLSEIIVVDNNSTDNSMSVLQEYQRNNPSIPLIIIEEKVRGYGSAYQKGFSTARGKYIFMADLDGTYDFADIPRFMEKINEGNDLVIGNRFMKNKTLGSMPWHHRYIGNPFLSTLVRLFFGVKVRDIHCGARMFKKDVLERITLSTIGMEFASEMIIKAAREHLSIAEIPIKYSDRIGTSKLQSLRDGWRHMRFIFLYSPLVLFLVPGLLLFVIGLVFTIILYFTNPSFLNITFYVHPLFLSSGCIIVGYQLIFFLLFAKTYAISHLKERSEVFEKLFKYITLERACIVGILFLICGSLIYGTILYTWIHSNFNSLNEIKNSIVALTLMVIGAQTIASSFMLSIISIKEK